MADKPQNETNEHSEHFSDDGFWDKVRKFSKVAGIEVLERALTLYYTYQEESTPRWAKATILGALGYFINPLDAIIDATPLVGFSDDLGVLTLAVATVAVHITEASKDKAKTTLAKWFG